MTGYTILWVLFLLIAIVIPPQEYMGAKGFMVNWDHYIEKPAKRLAPPKFIQVRYGIGKSRINIITYLTFLGDFANWLTCVVMLPCLLILKDSFWDTAMIVFGIIFVLINFPIGIVRTVCTIKTAKKQKIKLHTEEYSAMRSIAEVLASKPFSSHRKFMREYKEYTEIITPFLKEFEKCLKTQKGKQYISEDGLKWVTDRIVPKYQKHLIYNVLSEEPKNKILTIYLIKNNEIIIQVPVKKD